LNLTSDQQKRVLIIGLAELFNEKLTQAGLDRVINAVSRLSIAELQRAIELIESDKYIRKFPAPIEILRKAKGDDDVDIECKAEKQTQIILNSLSHYGHTRPERARAAIGEFEWGALGGSTWWAQCCRGVSEETLGVFRAQTLKSLRAAYRRGDRSSETRKLEHQGPEAISRLKLGLKDME